MPLDALPSAGFVYTIMLILNFSHPLTAEHLAQVEALTGQAVERVIDVPVHLELGQPLVEQIVRIVDDAGISSTEWQTLPLVINPPGYAPAAAVLLAELHGRMGYFPTILWLRPVSGSKPQQWHVAEIVNLQSMRQQAREHR